MIEKLKGELRKALDDNRNLTVQLEERKRLLEQAKDQEDEAVRASSLNTARELFRSMISNEGRGNGPLGVKGSTMSGNPNPWLLGKHRQSLSESGSDSSMIGGAGGGAMH